MASNELFPLFYFRLDLFCLPLQLVQLYSVMKKGWRATLQGTVIFDWRLMTSGNYIKVTKSISVL